MPKNRTLTLDPAEEKWVTAWNLLARHVRIVQDVDKVTASQQELCQDARVFQEARNANKMVDGYVIKVQMRWEVSGKDKKILTRQAASGRVRRMMELVDD